MLNGIPRVLSPELLKVLCEMGHGDTIVFGDANFPGAKHAKKRNAVYIRADGISIPDLLNATLQLIPLDDCVETPVLLMEKSPVDQTVEVTILEEYRKIVAKYCPKGNAAIGMCERFEFYRNAQDAFCIVETGETATYANIIIQKGIVKI